MSTLGVKSQAGSFSAEQVATETRHFLVRVYMWMGGGLALTGITAAALGSQRDLVMGMLRTPFLFYGLLMAELLMVWSFARMVSRVTATVAAAMFLGYAFLNGITFSIIFLVYARSSIAGTFAVTAGAFAGLSAYGAITKRDLSGWGSFLFMGLWGLVIAGVVNLFLGSGMLDWVCSCVGVVVFTGLTAYDTQKIIKLNRIGNEGTDEDTREAIHGALVLYLDFINLFLDLLRLFGSRR
jgi:FtsH-binding integral membrane protein